MRFFYVVMLAVSAVLASPLEAATYAFRTTAYNWETADTNVVWDQTQTAFPRDDDKQVVNLGFTFNFAGVNYTQVRIHANGVLQFGADTQFHRQFANTNLPVTTLPPACDGCTAGSQADRLLAIYWDDINPRLGGTVRYQSKGTGASRRFVVSWENVPHFNFGGQYTFQIVLYQSGEFVYQYGTGNASGVSATIGVEVDNNDYTLYSFDSSFSYAGTAIRWFKPSGEPQRLAEYWFEEGLWSNTPNEVIDWSYNGYNGNAIGSAQSTVNGRVCRAANMPLNTDAAISGINTNIDVDAAIGSSGGISFWYNSNNRWDTIDNQLFDATSQNNRWFYLTKRSNGRLRFAVSDSVGNTVAAETAANTTVAGVWRHIAVTWRLASGTNQTIVRIYIDGNLQSSQQGTTNGSLPASLGTLILGDNASNVVQSGLGTLNSADGRIDEVRVYNFEISNADVLNDMNASHDCVLIDHLRIEHDGQGLTCTAESITLKACSNANCSSLYPGIVTASITANGNNVGSVSFSGGSGGLQFNQLQAATLTLSGSLNLPTVSNTRCFIGGSESCLMTFTDTGWLFDAVPAQVSGQNFSSNIGLRAVRKDNNTGACQAELFGTQSVQLKLTCTDPGSCSTEPAMRFQFSDAANTVRELTKNNYSTYSLNFDGNGRAELRLPNYADVGQVRLEAQKQLENGAVLSGSSNNFVVRPHTLAVVAAERLGGQANPGTTTAGPGFVAAGEPFRLILEARNAAGLPTASFGRESVPARLTAELAALHYPAGGHGSAALLQLGGGFSSAAAMPGRMVNEQVSWHEAGSIQLAAKLVNDTYLATPDVSAKPVSAVIGRFYPQHFSLTSSNVQNSCAVFSYMSAPALTVHYVLEAKGVGGNTLQNYHTGHYPAGTATMLVLAQHSTGRLAAERLSVQAAQWQHGVYRVEQGDASVNRAGMPDGPYPQLQFGLQILAEQDNRNFQHFTLADDALALSGQLELRYGRLVLQNTAGPEEEPLPLAFRSEYWDGSRFVPNQADSCTTISSSQLHTVPPGSLTFSGSASLQNGVLAADLVVINPPNPAGNQTVEYQADPWLQYYWRGAAADYQQNPQAEVMFGRFRGNPRQISWRELFQ